MHFFWQKISSTHHNIIKTKINFYFYRLQWFLVGIKFNTSISTQWWSTLETYYTADCRANSLGFSRHFHIVNWLYILVLKKPINILHYYAATINYNRGNIVILNMLNNFLVFFLCTKLYELLSNINLNPTKTRVTSYYSYM